MQIAYFLHVAEYSRDNIIMVTSGVCLTVYFTVRLKILSQRIAITLENIQDTVIGSTLRIEE